MAERGMFSHDSRQKVAEKRKIEEEREEKRAKQEEERKPKRARWYVSYSALPGGLRSSSAVVILIVNQVYTLGMLQYPSSF